MDEISGTVLPFYSWQNKNKNSLRTEASTVNGATMCSEKLQVGTEDCVG